MISVKNFTLIIFDTQNHSMMIIGSFEITLTCKKPKNNLRKSKIDENRPKNLEVRKNFFL